MKSTFFNGLEEGSFEEGWHCVFLFGRFVEKRNFGAAAMIEIEISVDLQSAQPRGAGGRYRRNKKIEQQGRCHDS
jgi:hypothetical protein